jgi:hypothetical protein
MNLMCGNLVATLSYDFPTAAPLLITLQGQFLRRRGLEEMVVKVEPLAGWRLVVRPDRRRARGQPRRREADEKFSTCRMSTVHVMPVETCVCVTS